MWLWKIKDHISFDVGHRVDDFIRYENEEQFGHAATKLATDASEKVGEYRRMFRSIHDVSDFYVENAPKGFWPCFDAAIAHSLAGRTEASTRVLSPCLDDTNDDPQWLKEARSDARSLAASVGDVCRMQETISSRVVETRALLLLPIIARIDFEAGI